MERNYIFSRPRLLIKAAFSSPLEQEKGHRDSQATLDSGTARADVRVLGLVMKPQIRDDGKLTQEGVSGGWLVPSCHSGKWAPWVCCWGGQGCREWPGPTSRSRHGERLVEGRLLTIHTKTLPGLVASPPPGQRGFLRAQPALRQRGRVKPGPDTPSASVTKGMWIYVAGKREPSFISFTPYTQSLEHSPAAMWTFNKYLLQE